MSIQNFDERRDILIFESTKEAIDFSVEHFIEKANFAILDHGFFSVALSGGSTPKAIFKKLCEKENSKRIDFTKVILFWSDERNVPLDDAESNYKTAMDAGFKKLNIPEDHIFPMRKTGDLEFDAKTYDGLIATILPSGQFDLVMLGMGDDGHTASLFPGTKGLEIKNRSAIVNFIPEKKSYRLSLTFECINRAKEILIYVLGGSKAEMVTKVFQNPYNQELLPVQAVGTKDNKALWILDKDAASLMVKK